MAAPDDVSQRENVYKFKVVIVGEYIRAWEGERKRRA